MIVTKASVARKSHLIRRNRFLEKLFKEKLGEEALGTLHSYCAVLKEKCVCAISDNLLVLFFDSLSG